MVGRRVGAPDARDPVTRCVARRYSPRDCPERGGRGFKDELEVSL